MSTKIRWFAVTALVLALALVAGVWYKLYRKMPQPAWINADARDSFLYGSLGNEKTAGIPYWIWLVLPRIFPEYLPGPGGYASLGFSWEETREMPVGFAKQTVGYVRVAGNCAMCHAYSRSNGPDAAPTVFAAGTGRTAPLDQLLHFYQQCARDPRFNAGDILDEIGMATHLSLTDKLLYRLLLIPRTRRQLLNGRSAIVDAALWQHSRNPGSPSEYRQRLERLCSSLAGEEKQALTSYLQNLPAH